MAKKISKATRKARRNKQKSRKGGGSINIRYPSFNVNNSTTNRNSTSHVPTVSLQNLNLSTFIMYDPDALVPEWLHYLVINIPNGDISKGEVIISYEGPSPPPNTGIHRYIFEQFEQLEPLSLTIDKRGKFDRNTFVKTNNLMPRSKKSMRVPS